MTLLRPISSISRVTASRRRCPTAIRSRHACLASSSRSSVWLTATWIGQILLALAFLIIGYGHSVGYDRSVARPRMGWLAAVGRTRMRVIGSLEILGAIGLVLPAATGILPWLTPTAAASVVLLMVFAAVFHARRPGEGLNIVNNAFLGTVAALIAYGRFVVAPI